MNDYSKLWIRLSECGISDGSDAQRRWCGVNEDDTYLIYLYFVQNLKDERNMKFLYGYSCQFCLTQEGLDEWILSRDKKFNHIFQIRGYCTGRNLLKLLKAFEKNEPLGKILEQNEIKVRCIGCKEEVRNDIFLLSFFQGIPKYRPAYILEPRKHNDRLINAFRPQSAIGDHSMRCESLVGCNPREFYCKDLKPDAGKIMELHAFLKSIYVSASVNDMARLGCFELLSYLDGKSGEDNGIHWEIKKKDPKNVCKTSELKVVLDHHFFSGHYAMLIRVCNTQNNFLEHLELVNCIEKDYVHYIPLHESPGTIEIRLYKLSGNSFETNLVADFSATLIRNISLNMRIADRRFQLEDSWSKKMKNNGKNIDTTAEYVSQENRSINDKESEVWYENEKLVREECGQILNLNSKGSQGIFFEAGDDMHIRFLNWLKRTLDNVFCKRVVIIDPYIDGDAIGKILRGITNPSVTYDIYTAYDVSKKTGQEKKERINEIKNVLEQVRLVVPSFLNVYAVSGDDLHDRFLILEPEDTRETIVYSMSNSLDNVGQHHSSIVVPLDQLLASKVNRFYLELIEKKKTENKIETVFSVSNTNISMFEEEEGKQDRIIHSVEEYRSLCKFNLAEALSQLAYLEPGDLKNSCKEELANVDGVAEKIKLLLDDYCASIPNIKSKKNNVKHQAYEERNLFSIGQNLSKDMEWNLKLMDSADYMDKYFAEYLYCHEPWYIRNAVRYFCNLETKRAVEYLSILRQAMNKEESENIKLRKLAAMLIIRLIELLKYKEDEKVAEYMLDSDIPFLHAIVIANGFSGISDFDEKYIENAIKQLEALDRRLSFKEQLVARIYVIQELQICCCRKREHYEIIQSVIDEIITNLVTVIRNASLQAADYDRISDDDLYQLFHALYSRNSEDICKIYVSLVECAYMDSKRAGKYLQKMFLEPFDKGLKEEKNIYYRAKDLYEYKHILSYINTVDSSSIKTLFKEIKKKERLVIEPLYSVTFKEQNHSLWKCYMDMLCCFVYLELWAEQNYQYNPGKAVEEFKAISSNYKSTLEKYSEPYQMLVREYKLHEK